MATLLELSGALGIASILGITAITSMSSAPGEADDVRARASLRAAVITALSVDVDAADDDDMLLAASFAVAEPAMEWTALDSSDANIISVASRRGALGLATRSVSGTCFVARVGVDGTVIIDELAPSGACTGDGALTSA